METLGHLLFLVGMMLAFLAAMFGFVLLFALKGGRLAQASMYEAVGLIILAVNVFVLYGSAITGQLDLLHPTIFWPILGFLALLGFGLLAIGKYQMMKVI